MLDGRNGLATLDRGIQNGGTAVAAAGLDTTNTAVLCFGADALIETEGRPVAADLTVSPQHRVLVRSRTAQKVFGTDEVLVAAKQLLLLDGIDIAEDLDQVTYVHLLFDDHQVIWSNGAETESLHPGRNALTRAGEAAREEILALFPELRDETVTRPAARVLASGRMGRKLAMRHPRSQRPLVA